MLTERGMYRSFLTFPALATRIKEFSTADQYRLTFKFKASPIRNPAGIYYANVIGLCVLSCL